MNVSMILTFQSVSHTFCRVTLVSYKFVLLWLSDLSPKKCTYVLSRLRQALLFVSPDRITVCEKKKKKQTNKQSKTKPKQNQKQIGYKKPFLNASLVRSSVSS